jgi:hypothetical protein
MKMKVQLEELIFARGLQRVDIYKGQVEQVLN